jgi:hypothetical protein
MVDKRSLSCRHRSHRVAASSAFDREFTSRLLEGSLAKMVAKPQSAELYNVATDDLFVAEDVDVGA